MRARLITLLVRLPAFAVLAGIYGALHDQLSFTISPEYFTRFKYERFGFDPAWFGGHRPTVAVIGFLATWWVGLLVGLFLSGTALPQPDARRMRKAIQRGAEITFVVAVVSAILGVVAGHFILTGLPDGWYMPADVTDRRAFLTVGAMHNASYLGGVLGLVIALTDMEWLRQGARARP